MTRRERILAAVREVGTFAPVTEIARAADISVGAIYLDFRTKEEIVAALVREDIATGVAPLDAIKRYLPTVVREALE